MSVLDSFSVSRWWKFDKDYSFESELPELGLSHGQKLRDRLSCGHCGGSLLPWEGIGLLKIFQVKENRQ